MLIRTMNISDYEKVYALWMSCKNMGFNNLDDSREGIDRFLKRNPNTSFVALENDEIIGIVLAGHDGRRGYVYHMSVREENRHQGIGTSLVDKCLSAQGMRALTRLHCLCLTEMKLVMDFGRSKALYAGKMWRIEIRN